MLARREMLVASASTLLTSRSVHPPGAASTRLGDMGFPLRPEMFGALGDGGDDTAGLIALAAAVTLRGNGHIRFSPGKTYLLAHLNQLTILFQKLTWLFIEGAGATLKTADSGAPTDLKSSAWGQNWGQINLDNCSNVKIENLVLDGNRANQAHTSGQPDGYGFNAGISFWTSGAHTTSNVQIRGCRFKNHGVLSSTTDARGDGIYAMSGISHVVIEDNDFENCGRWAFALTEGPSASSHVYFRNNRCRMGTRRAGFIPWGAVDIEDHGLGHSHIHIEDNVFTGTSNISFLGNATGVGEITVSDIHIRRNKWRLPEAGGSLDVPLLIGGGSPATGTYRTFQHLFVENNICIWNGRPIFFHIGHTSKLVDAFIRNNHFMAETRTSTSDNGLMLAFRGHMEGRIEVRGNTFVGLGEAIKNANTWYADPSPSPLQLRIENNRFDNCYRAYNLQFNGLAAPVGISQIIFRGNRSENTRDASGEYVDGGRLKTSYYDRAQADKIWSHRNVSYGD